MTALTTTATRAPIASASAPVPEDFAHAGGAATSDDRPRAGGGDVSRNSEYARLQAQYAAEYQQSLARAAGDPAATDEPGRRALAQLIASVEPLLYNIAGRKMVARLGHVNPDLLEDAVAEMTVAVIEAAAKFDPSRCPAFYAWVTGEQGAARAALYAALDFSKRADGWEDRDRRALAIAAKSRAVLRDELQREPSLPELQSHMREYCLTYQLNRQGPTERSQPMAERREMARKKLVNAGMLARINDIGPMLELSRAAVTPDDDDIGWDALGVSAPDQLSGHGVLEAAEARTNVTGLLAVAFAGLTSLEQSVVAARLGVVEGQNATLASVAAKHGVTTSRVRELAVGAAARMQAGHAHYALLAPGLLSQFEDTPPVGALPRGLQLV